MMNPRYTLVIPHYNQPQKLGRLLQSVPMRDDLQVVVADDGSEASFGGALQALQVEYPQVEFLLLPENKGGGAARNAALQMAKGDYVLFADADDAFVTEALNGLLDKYANEDFDLLGFNAIAVEEDTGVPSARTDRLNWMMVQPKNERERLLRYLHSEPWCKLIRRELLVEWGIRFDETPMMNDVRFSYLVGHYARRVVVENSVCYRIYNNVNSVGKTMSPQRKRAYTQVMAQANRFFRQHGLPYCYKRAYRPLVFSLLKGQWRDVAACVAELKAVGESGLSIGWNVCLYPLWLVRWALRRRCYCKARLVVDVKNG
ncbi:MAG: glycosyltransferase [Bacteroidaceae bacterium]|nr:glycosyltransferase [Bacteroidaceae bacterium]